MKTLFTLIIASLALLFSGCATTANKNATTFLSQIKGMGIVANDITQTTKTPIYSHSESATGIAKDANGNLTVVNLKVGLMIPLWGTSWDLSASGIQIIAPGSVKPVEPPIVVPVVSSPEAATTSAALAGTTASAIEKGTTPSVPATEDSKK
jgi:hypothetical protein